MGTDSSGWPELEDVTITRGELSPYCRLADGRRAGKCGVYLRVDECLLYFHGSYGDRHILRYLSKPHNPGFRGPHLQTLEEAVKYASFC